MQHTEHATSAPVEKPAGKTRASKGEKAEQHFARAEREIQLGKQATRTREGARKQEIDSVRGKLNVMFPLFNQIVAMSDLVKEPCVAAMFNRVLGMEPWIVHAHQLLDLPRPAYPDGLTSREVEILTMIGEGHPVEGIASALGVAALAARKETARACAKIGARGRRAAAAYAIDHRFVAPAS